MWDQVDESDNPLVHLFLTKQFPHCWEGVSYVNGNTLTGGGRTNTWDSQNRLAQCVYNGTTSQFTYGSDGLRRSMKVGTGHTTHYALDGQSVVREFSDVNDDDELFNQDGTIQAGELMATYLVGPRGVEYREDASGARKWYLYDGLGSVLGEVDETGQVTATNRTDVFGKQRASSGTSTTGHKFCGSLGHSTDDGTGLIYMRARYMDPELGRFVSEDPAKDGTNWYTYCNNNPVNLSDADGQVPEWIVAAVFTVIGMVTGHIADAVMTDVYRRFAKVSVTAFLNGAASLSRRWIFEGTMQAAKGACMLETGNAIDAAGSEFIGKLCAAEGASTMRKGIAKKVAGIVLGATVRTLGYLNEIF